MARSSRSASRAVSPPKAPGRTAGARITRSQSRDLGDNEYLMLDPQKMTRNSRQTSADSVSIPNRRLKATRATEIDRDLAMVEEGVEEEEDGAQPSKPTGKATSETEYQDVTDLNTDLIIDALPTLEKYSSEIIKQIPPGLTLDKVLKIREYLASPDSRLAKKMGNFMGHLEVSKANFGNGVYIDYDFIFQKLFGTQDPDSIPGRLDAIIYKANIAVVFDLLARWLGPPEKMEVLEKLDEVFPAPFIPAWYMEDDNERKMWKDTFDLALEIRTQLAIIALQKYQGHDNFDPDSLIAQIFYQGDEGMSAEEILQEGQPRSIAGLNLAAIGDMDERVAARIGEIRQAEFDDTQAHITKEYVDMDELRSKFPWEDFLITCIDWMHERAEEYDHVIEEEGGVDKMIEALSEYIPDHEHEITLNYDPPPAESTPEPLSTNISKVESAAEKKKRLRMAAGVLYGPSSQAQLQRLAKSHSESRDLRGSTIAGPSKPLTTIQETPPKPVAQRVSYDDGGMNAFGADEDMEAENSPSPPDTGKFGKMWNGSDREKNKENNKPTGKGHANRKKSLMDPQPGAKKVGFGDEDDEDDDDEDDKSSKRPNPSRKRNQEQAAIDDRESMFVSQAAEEDSPSEDGGFEEDERVRHSAPAKASPKRPRVQPGGSNARRADSEAGHNARRRHQDENEDFSDENIAPVPSQSYKVINAEAKRIVAMSKVPTRQIRVPWTSAECEALVDLIGEHGSSYSAISKSAEARDTIQERHREQVALKDKARNIKVDYLLSGQPLPLNFDKIKLGQKEKDKVIRAGLNPYRQEGEEVGKESLDENGEPIE